MSWGDLTPQNQIKGDTTGVYIGNVGDRLKVIATQELKNNLQFYDATLARGTVIAVTTWTSFYSYTGAGQFYGFLANLEGASGAEGSRWYVRVIIDGTKYVFGTAGLLISDLTDANLYNIADLTSQFCGLGMQGNVIRYQNLQAPIYFSTSIDFQVYRISSTKKFRAGIICIGKD